MTNFKSIHPSALQRGSRGEDICGKCKKILISNDSKEHGLCGSCARASGLNRNVSKSLIGEFTLRKLEL